MSLGFRETDGGRKDAGYKGYAGDCAVRAIAIALDQGYRETYAEVGNMLSHMTGGLDTSPRDGIGMPVFHSLMHVAGATLVKLSKQYLTPHAIPMSGTVICVMSRHYVTVIDGVVYDSWDSRHDKRTKCGAPKLLGYYYWP